MEWLVFFSLTWKHLILCACFNNISKVLRDMTVRVAGRSICQEKVNLKPLLDAETFLTVAVIYDV